MLKVCLILEPVLGHSCITMNNYYSVILLVGWVLCYCHYMTRQLRLQDKLSVCALYLTFHYSCISDQRRIISIKRCALYLTVPLFMHQWSRKNHYQCFYSCFVAHESWLIDWLITLWHYFPVVSRLCALIRYIYNIHNNSVFIIHWILMCQQG